MSDAEDQLNARIAAGRALVDTEAAELGELLAKIPYARRMYSPGTKPQGQEKVDALARKVEQWRDYNRSWLRSSLGGEAAAEYQSISEHMYLGGADDPRINLRWLCEEVESEISKLESIRERLPMWAPQSVPAFTASTSRTNRAEEIMTAFTVPDGYDFLSRECQRFFVDHPVYEKNVFVMTRFDSANRFSVTLDQEIR